MATPRTSEQGSCSDLLTRYATSGCDVDADGALDLLFTQYAQPWCREITRSALYKYPLRSSERRDQAEETEAEVLLQVTARLHAVRQGAANAIVDLRAYIASCVYNVCFQRLRAKSPERCRLANRVRYLLRHDARFAQWDAADETLAGLRHWGGNAEHEDPVLPEFPSRELDRLIGQIFESTGGPVALGNLISAVARILGVADSQAVEFPDTSLLTASVPNVEATLDRAQRLRLTWLEVLALPRNQRGALLLNLRDAEGQGVIELLPATGVASFEELAAALGMRSSELIAIWNDLPLHDNGIAELLGLKRQQVINLRKSARERIARRLSAPSGNMGPVSESMNSRGAFLSAGRVVRKMCGRERL